MSECQQCQRESPPSPCEAYHLRNQERAYNKRVTAVVERLRVKGARVRVKRRKLAHRKKTYLHIRAGGTHNTFSMVVMPLIRQDFPEAYMTSGGFSSRVPDPHMNITVSLDPR